MHVFGHDLLMQRTRDRFKNRLPEFRRLIDDWADDYATQGWPPDTPRYFLVPYGQQLAEIGAADRLTSMATDPARHDRMRVRTNTDAAALAEVERAQQLLVDQPEPDLTALVLLVVEHDRLAQRSQAIPTDLPGLWARLGHPHRATALAGTIRRPEEQARALTGVAGALAAAGQVDRAGRVAAEAEQVARAIPDADRQAWVLTGVAGALAAAGQVDRAGRVAAEAEQVARAIPDADRQAWVLTGVAGALAAAGQVDRAGRVAAEAGRVAAARSPIPPGRPGGLPAWRGRWPVPARPIAPSRSPTPSPTPPRRPRRWSRWPGRYPARLTGVRRHRTRKRT